MLLEFFNFFLYKYEKDRNGSVVVAMDSDIILYPSQTFFVMLVKHLGPWFSLQNSCKKKSISMGQVLKNDRIWSYWEQGDSYL